MKVCKYCGKEFEPNAQQRLYCSDSCRRAANNAKRRKRPKKMSPLDWDVHIMAIRGIQYGKLQGYRLQGLTDNDILKRHAKR